MGDLSADRQRYFGVSAVLFFYVLLEFICFYYFLITTFFIIFQLAYPLGPTLLAPQIPHFRNTTNYPNQANYNLQKSSPPFIKGGLLRIKIS